jgi:hypothetical protein
MQCPLPNLIVYLAGDGEAAPVKKKVVYAKKKQAPKKQPSDASNAELEAQAAEERSRQQAEVLPHLEWQACVPMGIRHAD